MKNGTSIKEFSARTQGVRDGVVFFFDDITFSLIILAS